MAATVNFISAHGTTGASETDVTSGQLRFKLADNDAADLNDPVPIPSSGTQNSFAKNCFLKMATTPANQIANVVFYTDGTISASLWPGFVTLIAKSNPSYLNPIANGTTLLTSAADAFTYTISSPLVIGAGPFTTTGRMGNYLQLQAVVSAGATSGVTGGETLTMQYDEI